MKTKTQRQDAKNAKMRKQIKAIKPAEYSPIRMQLKFAKAVDALRILVDAMEELSAELVATEKFNRLSPRLRASALKS